MDKVKTRCWVMVLYPDDPTHFSCMNTLATGGYSYCAVLHDRDVWAENESDNHVAGTAKKTHWHVVLRFRNPRWRSAVAEELGIAPNYLEVCREMDKALLYLVHEGYDEKYQYGIDDVFGPLSSNLERLLVSDDENERVITIVNMIDSSPGKVTYREILLKACNAGLYGDFRRLGSGVKWLIDEHNDDDSSMPFEYQKRQIDKDEFAEFVKWHSRLSKAGELL